MAFKLFSKREKEIWRQAKIVAYYQSKRKKKKRTQSSPQRYGNFDVNEAFERALQRSYGDNSKTR